MSKPLMPSFDIQKYALGHEDVGIPYFPKADFSKCSPHPYTLFNLSSHARAREAIEFGLKLRTDDFHVFVVGEDRSGRMTATLTYLQEHIQTLSPPPDWIYLNNFKKPHRPLPFKLPNGNGVKVLKGVKEHIKNLETILKKTFSSPSYLKQIDKISMQLDQQIQDDLHKVQIFAEKYGFEVLQTPEGFQIQERQDLKINEKNNNKRRRDTQIAQIKDQLNRLTLAVSLASRSLLKQIKILQETLTKSVTKTLWYRFRSDFSVYLESWIDDFEADVIENIELFLEEEEEKRKTHYERYFVNLFVDNLNQKHPRVILEANPSYENLFGAIKNRISTQGTYETNFTLMRGGSLHFANEGILVLRAEAIAKDPDVWEHLKAALRDKKIRIQEHTRDHTGSSLIDAPDPYSIPLDVQVFIVGQPMWYYSFFFSDPEFRIYFKIKADIDPDLDITPQNVLVYSKLIAQSAEDLSPPPNQEAIHYLTRCSARWAGNREKLSSRFEIVHDVLAEAKTFAEEEKSSKIEKSHIRKALLGRRARNARIQDDSYEDILKNTLLIETEGSEIGQINGLTVLNHGDFSFGLPARISARTYVGQLGVINIERLTEMGGPIQQKGAFILDGFLNGHFAQDFPVSFSCSLTFEQSYQDVEGDSASLAELCAILSSLAHIPLRQDIAVTGSIDQFGATQAVGGIYHKIEGFFEICQRRGLTGKQGVIIPKANKVHLTLKDEIVDAMQEGLFNIYAVESVFEAMEILTGTPSITQNHRFFGLPLPIKQTGVFQKVHTQLKAYHYILTHHG